MEAVVIYMEPVLWFMKTLLELAATLHLQAAVRSWGDLCEVLPWPVVR